MLSFYWLGLGFGDGMVNLDLDLVRLGFCVKYAMAS
jgi:hypothetical protein